MAGVDQPHESLFTSPAVDSTVDYYQRKTAGRCTKTGCTHDRSTDSQLCRRHLAKHRRAARLSARRLRRARRDNGLCASPGCETRCETWYCPACAIQHQHIPSPTIDSTIDSRTTQQRDVWRDDANGWHRFRGRGKRGAPPIDANDESDLRMILEAIQQKTKALTYARSPEVQQLGRITKQAALNEVAKLFTHASRGLDDIIDRLRK